tara:strand:- start:1319 stop:1495 length:177 start_codon:yes stop_codon:yes gene_type:complete
MSYLEDTTPQLHTLEDVAREVLYLMEADLLSIKNEEFPVEELLICTEIWIEILKEKLC